MRTCEAILPIVIFLGLWKRVGKEFKVRMRKIFGLGGLELESYTGFN